MTRVFETPHRIAFDSFSSIFFSDKGCIAVCVENMQRTPDLKPLEIVEMFVTVFCFLKVTSGISKMW